MYVEIACIIDESGSMESTKSASIEGYNSFLKQQQELPGEAKFSLVFFNTVDRMVYNAVDLHYAAPLTDMSYRPYGGTALYDAVGRTIDSLGERFSSAARKPDKVVFVILTDGEENSSRSYTKQMVADKIKHQKEKYAWEFIFLAANQDAFATGSGLNIPQYSTFNYVATEAGTRDAYAVASASLSNFRA